ncbi:MAG: M28 family peptidase [Bacteroidetes bacterium]|jgi:Zn-dependent M28 family amino/carboxypeptidase|nr:M28 family peptidase [Bacteroidota bacterium]MBT6685778.1 M28 family peptidase [Bacteroidota bacterium]MBT7142348.1 M28 family peptidase [Bacteroidota bacterium]MBT7492028.1 M28 family peptidase [Bacteroidota bacterium]
MKSIKIAVFFTFMLLFFACQEKPQQQQNSNSKKKISKVERISVPKFNADSAYIYVKKQCDFGPRVPNTKAHFLCSNYLKKKMENFGADVIVQETRVKAFDGTSLNIKNIIAQFSPEKKNRLLLFAHWDSRPFADHCENPEKRDSPIIGANDGASGVGILMEIGRQIGIKNTKLGIDIIFFDAEDYGYPDHKNIPHQKDTWCLGSQYWAKNIHTPNYYARYGILLDMVGAKNAMFYQEQISLYYAPSIVNKVWSAAFNLGFSNYFIFNKGGQITDDHQYVNEIANIPSIDIIQHDPSTKSNFGSYWHTHNDNFDIIDKNTLNAVGQTVLEVIYKEK